MFFFFSSRRRHTRSTRDWSSDVCSSDLEKLPIFEVAKRQIDRHDERGDGAQLFNGGPCFVEPSRERICLHPPARRPARSEERRVGKECRSRCARYHKKEKATEEHRQRQV